MTDAATGEPLGMFYLDMFPREGKFNHFAEFEIIGGKLVAQRQISAARPSRSSATSRRPAKASHRS